MTQVTERTFDLEAGDRIVMNKESGELCLLKTTGETLDLNSMVKDVTEGSGEMCVRMLNPPAFMHLCSILATSYGLTANTVRYENFVFTCEIVTPTEG